jgi:hypothetical protein
VSMLGHVLWPGVDARAHTLLNLPAWLAPWPAFLRPLVSWIQPDAPVAGYGAISGLGFSWLLGGLPASLVLAAWVLRRRRVPIAMPWLLVTATLVLALQPAPWWGRFTLWLHALGLPAVAVLMQAAWDAPRRVPAALAALWLVVLVGVASWETSVVLRRGAADGRGADGIYADSIDYVFPELRATAPPAWHARCLARSRWGRWGTLLGGGLAQPAGARRIQVVDADVAPEALVRDGIRWVLWDVAGAGAPPRALLDAAVERHDYAPSQDLYFVLLELGEPAGVPSR